jgi:hypothetical protein
MIGEVLTYLIGVRVDCFLPVHLDAGSQRLERRVWQVVRLARWLLLLASETPRSVCNEKEGGRRRNMSMMMIGEEGRKRGIRMQENEKKIDEHA